MTKINEDFEYCIEKFGPPRSGEKIPDRVLDLYREKVPQSMSDFWEEFGVGLWLDGRFQLVRPDFYQGLINMILANDPDFPPRMSVAIGFSAFGRLLVWNNKNYLLEIDLVEKFSYTRHVDSRHPIIDANISLPSDLSRVDAGSYDYHEHSDDAKPLFAHAMKKCGKLAYGECYGFVPAVGLGGRGNLEEVQRVRALEHFSLIAQLEPIELRYMDTKNRKIVVLRELGG